MIKKILQEKWKIRKMYLFDTCAPNDYRKQIKLKSLQAGGYGYKVIKTELKELPNGTFKSDKDAKMLLEIPEILRRYYPQEIEVVIMSGDGVFVQLIEKAHARDFFCWIVAFSRTLSDELANVADEVVTMEEILTKAGLIAQKVAEKEIEEAIAKSRDVDKTQTPSEGKINEFLKKTNPFS
jgi:uncharacterized LabA/DUF88 family protein